MLLCKPHELPANEAMRLQALQRYEVLDTPPDGSFDRITAIAARLFNVPIAIISLVDHDRIWFKSHHGLTVEQIDRTPGFCASAILSSDFYEVSNAVQDVRTLTNPLVAGEFGLRFYAAAPLTTQDGYGLGTLCIIDQQPRKLTTAEQATLTDLAQVVMDELEIRLRAKQVDHLNSELAKAKQAAEVANEAKSTFLANMSHELRSPLNAILGFTQIMAQSKDLAPDHYENLHIISRSGEHLLTLINNILDLSKIEAGRITLNPVNFDLHCLLQDLEDMFQYKADQQRLSLSFDLSPDLPTALCTDETKLRQVLINLINNALKFTRVGGVVVRGEVVEISPALNPPKATLRFSIEDSGPGIAPDELGQLFEAFAQTKTGRESEEGTGLGLPISRKFVQLMGGEIEVKSELGDGTTFSFTVEADIVPPEAVAPSPSELLAIALAPGQPTYRLLIVDDKPLNRQLLVRLLTPFGFELQEAINGLEAIEIALAWQPHLIWMDMRMPVMDGYEATQRIKSSAQGQAIAIIALTASVLEEERVIALAAGCDDFFRKPFRAATIFDALHRHIGVEFIYENEAPEMGSKLTLSELETVVNPQALGKLPRQFLVEFEAALILSSITKIEAFIEELRAYDGAIANALAPFVRDFDYETILTLLEPITTVD